MYQYTQFDKQFVLQRAQQFRDQLQRWERGELTDEQLLPLRLQNGWYVQRYAPMARIASFLLAATATWLFNRSVTFSDRRATAGLLGEYLRYLERVMNFAPIESKA